MVEPPTPTELEPRYQTPDPADLPEGTMTVEDAGKYIRAILECGRKKNAKTEIFTEICNRYDPVDYYWFCRLFVSERFAEPGLALGVGKAAIDEGVATKVLSEGEVRELRDNYDTLFEAFEDRGIRRETEGEMLFTEMYGRLLDIAETSGDKATVHKIGKVAADTPYPFVWLKMLGDAPAFYVYGDNILEGFTKSMKCALPFEQVRERAEMLGDRPLAVWDALSSDREFSTDLTPHQKLGEMKAESDITASDIYDGSTYDPDEWVAQTKYDGARLYVHHAGDGDYRAYLAGGRDVTAELPELFVNDVYNELPDTSFILDCEATPYDAETGEVLPFQNVLKRAGREGGVTLEDEEVEVRFKFFDCLYWDGHDVRHMDYRDRFKIVKETFLPPRVARTGSNLESAFHRSIDRGHEGVVLKHLDTPYEMDTRSTYWQKWKAEPMEIDCEIGAVYEGSGRLEGSVGAFGLRLETVEVATPVSVGRVGTGFSDAERDRLWTRHNIKGICGEVVQVSFEELQYNKDDGWALRFPSFDAMRPEGEVDTLERVACDIAEMESEYEFWESHL